MNILLWVLQVALAWLCIAGGYFQIAKLEQLKPQTAAMRELPEGLWKAFGAANCVGGLGLVLPAAVGVLPVLTPVAAAAVAVESLVISALYVRHGDKAPLPFSLVMALLGAFIAYGRFVLKPF